MCVVYFHFLLFARSSHMMIFAMNATDDVCACLYTFNDVYYIVFSFSFFLSFFSLFFVASLRLTTRRFETKFLTSNFFFISLNAFCDGVCCFIFPFH